MATRFVTNLDLNNNQLINGRFESLASDPDTNLFEGRLIYRTDLDCIKYYSGSAWEVLVQDVTSNGSASAALTINLNNNGSVTVTPNLATATDHGVMSSSDKALLDTKTSEATALSLVRRDASGNFKAAYPTDSAHVATKGYVDAARSGLDVKQSVRAATTGPINLATDLENGDILDTTVTLVTGDRVLVKNQSTASENGIYVVQASGAAVRATDANGTADTGVVSGGTFTFVEEGTVNADSGWVVTSNGLINVGTDAINWVQFSGAGQITAGAGLTKTGNTIDAVGTENRITVNSDSIDIASTYVGQTSINTLGTITTGTWDATTVAVTAGGTGQESFTDNGVIYGNGTGALDVTAAPTQYQVLRGNASGVPEFGQITLSASAAVTGQLPIANGGTNASTESGARTNLAAGGVQGSGVSTPVLARKVVKTIGNGVDTSFTVVHAFGTEDVMIQVFDASSKDTVIADTIRTDADTVTVTFSVAPSSNAFKVVVIG